MRDGAWLNSPDFCCFPERTTEIAESVFVVIGGGATGTAVATVAGALGADVRVVSARDRRSLDAALAEADFVSLHIRVFLRVVFCVENQCVGCAFEGLSTRLFSVDSNRAAVSSTRRGGPLRMKARSSPRSTTTASRRRISTPWPKSPSKRLAGRGARRARPMFRHATYGLGDGPVKEAARRHGVRVDRRVPARRRASKYQV